jgi:hypothetical protein
MVPDAGIRQGDAINPTRFSAGIPFPLWADDSVDTLGA